MISNEFGYMLSGILKQNYATLVESESSLLREGSSRKHFCYLCTILEKFDVTPKIVLFKFKWGIFEILGMMKIWSGDLEEFIGISEHKYELV